MIRRMFDCRLCTLFLATMLTGLLCLPAWGETNQENAKSEDSDSWRQKAVQNARIMSGVKWSPVAEGMPTRGGYFKVGTEYTGVPYSSVKSVGRDIGFDIYLKTFLAAVQNPQSVVYTKNLKGKVSNAECYYGKVCSTYTSYALQCGFPYVSRLCGPESRNGVTLVEPQSAQATQVGDFIYTPPKSVGAGSHIAIVTEVTMNSEGQVSHVRVEESRPQTTQNTNRSAAKFNSHLASRNNKLYRITDLDAWHGENRADSFRFPNFEEDSASPQINRVLLLDLGDWVPYNKDQVVKFNIMDKDSQQVKSLIIKRGDTVVETITDPGTGVLERSFSTCGDYAAYCELGDGSRSQACEFSVCDLDFALPDEEIRIHEPWELHFSSANLEIAAVHIWSNQNMYGRNYVFLTEEDRKNGKVVIPADAIQHQGSTQVWLIGENKYGRLKKRLDVVVKE
ncbi:hypothetical protein M4951_24155 [Blastopirellula sp. J2-11]|uniref:hypothetical protein n=1 Tax=Blastopirellula sp. J2-11 TaxID=2943192 RepID=UPI0021CA20E8|nr:hypothetical protein [Blastopirellula sp. J2-11]UUO06427.1 hypothetical protein M4951_24155 [Blastopirellula sp. J2-11]